MKAQETASACQRCGLFRALLGECPYEGVEELEQCPQWAPQPAWQHRIFLAQGWVLHAWWYTALAVSVGSWVLLGLLCLWLIRRS